MQILSYLSMSTIIPQCRPLGICGRSLPCLTCPAVSNEERCKKCQGTRSIAPPTSLPYYIEGECQSNEMASLEIDRIGPVMCCLWFAHRYVEVFDCFVQPVCQCAAPKSLNHSFLSCLLPNPSVAKTFIIPFCLLLIYPFLKKIARISQHNRLHRCKVSKTVKPFW